MNIEIRVVTPTSIERNSRILPEALAILERATQSLSPPMVERVLTHCEQLLRAAQRDIQLALAVASLGDVLAAYDAECVDGVFCNVSYDIRSDAYEWGIEVRIASITRIMQATEEASRGRGDRVGVLRYESHDISNRIPAAKKSTEVAAPAKQPPVSKKRRMQFSAKKII